MNRFLVKSITSLLARSYKPSPLSTSIIGMRANSYFSFCTIKTPQNNNQNQNQNKNQLKDTKKQEKISNQEREKKRAEKLEKKLNSKKYKMKQEKRQRKKQRLLNRYGNQGNFIQQIRQIREETTKGIGRAKGENVRVYLQPPLSHDRNFYITTGTKLQSWKNSSIRLSHLI